MKALKREAYWLGRSVMMSLLVNLFIESASRKSIFAAVGYLVLHPVIFLLNGLIVLLPYMLVFLTRRRYFIMVAVSAAWCVGDSRNGWQTPLSGLRKTASCPPEILLRDLPEICNAPADTAGNRRTGKQTHSETHRPNRTRQPETRLPSCRLRCSRPSARGGANGAHIMSLFPGTRCTRRREQK